MNQLLLDLGPPPRPTFDNFIAGRNAEPLTLLRRMCEAPVADPPARCLYLWGEHGAGRSHLLQAACSQLGGTLLAGGTAEASPLRDAVDVEPGRARWLLAVDGVEDLDADAQEALFHALNAMRADPRGIVLVAGNAAPRDLKLAAGRDDLRSRLAWGLVFHLHRLDDADKDEALARRAAESGFPLSPDVRRYLMTHFARDLGSLMRMVDALDRYALEQRRVVTVPMIRDFLQRTMNFEAGIDHAA